jgi:hypothetical protein
MMMMMMMGGDDGLITALYRSIGPGRRVIRRAFVEMHHHTIRTSE